MTAPRPGDPFHLDLGGTAIAGHYLEVDPPHRLVIEWDLPRSDDGTATSALVEITLTPTGGGTDVKVHSSGLSADDAALHQQLWARHLDQIAASFAGSEPRGDIRLPSRPRNGSGVWGYPVASSAPILGDRVLTEEPG